MKNDAIGMSNHRNGECIWWGEAPERRYDWSKAAGGLLPNDTNTPKHPPSRGLALHHGSARFQAYPHHLAKLISGSDSTVQPFGSLAPPSLSPIRPFAPSLP